MLALVLLFSGCAGNLPATTATEPATAGPPDEQTFDVEGVIYGASASETECDLLWGGMQPSLDTGQVTIHDGAGDAVALGTIGQPTVSSGVTAEGDEIPLCVYRYEVPDVPSGVGPYTYEVGSGLVSSSRFTEEDAEQLLKIDFEFKD